MSIGQPETATAAFGELPRGLVYLSVGLSAGAVIALQICLMRIFAVGSWAHFGSLVVSLALLGFGLASAIMCVAERWFDLHWRGAAATALVLFGPLAVAANLLVQQFPFNAIFIVSDPAQKWRLGANLGLYLLPFLSGAFFLGIVFLRGRKSFGHVYFADLAGAGVSGLLFLGAMYFFSPENLIIVPLVLWFAGCIAWFAGLRQRPGLALATAAAVAAIGGHYLLPRVLDIPKLEIGRAHV